MRKCICALVFSGLMLCPYIASAVSEPRTILTDGQTNVIYSEVPSIAVEGEALNLLISPYEYAGKRVAVLIGEDGEIKRSFIAVDTEFPLGEGSEAYDLLFPKIEDIAYERGCKLFDELGGLTGDLWYYLVKDIRLTKRERLAVVDFINWVKEREDEAMGDTLTYTKLPGGNVELFQFYAP